MAQAQQAGQPNREQPKRVGKNKFSHTPDTPYGMGDYYGVALKNPTGKLREQYLSDIPETPKQLRTPPKSFA